MSEDLSVYVGTVPWTGLGAALPVGVSAAEAIKVSGLDWDVETAPIVTDDHKRTAIDDYRITRRMTDNAILGIVRKKFKPIQNRDAFELFDGISQAGQMVYQSAGELRGGSRVFLIAKLPEVIEIGKGVGTPDAVERYLVLSNSHDGRRPLQISFTPVRVICENTLDLSLTRKGDDAVTALAPRVRIMHSEKAAKRMEEASRLMTKAAKYYAKFGDFANFLYREQISVTQVNNVVHEVFPPNKKKIVTPATAFHRNEVIRLFDEGAGHDKIAGSAWALLNAFTEYADHQYSFHKAAELQDRAYSILAGGAAGLKRRATRAVADLVS